MYCCTNKNVIKVKSEYICKNCATCTFIVMCIHDYEYAHFNYDDYDYDIFLNNMIKNKKFYY